MSADNRFTLYVNGKRVAEGPARGNPGHWRYEELDLAPYLKLGTNVLAAQVWNDAKDSPLAQMSTWRTAFWMQAQESRYAPMVDSDASWRVRVNAARSVSPGSVQIAQLVGPAFYAAAPPETLDSAKQAPDRADPISRAADWHSARLFSDAEALAWTLEPDALPAMRYERVSSGHVVRANGVASSSFPDKALEVGANIEATILVDAGCVLSAYPVLIVSGGKGAQISITYVESLYDPDSKSSDPQSSRHLRFPDLATVGNGLALGLTDTFNSGGTSEQRFEPSCWRAWRYVQIRIKTAAEPVTLKDFQTWETGYPSSPTSGRGFSSRTSMDMAADSKSQGPMANSSGPRRGRTIKTYWFSTTMCATQLLYATTGAILRTGIFSTRTDYLRFLLEQALHNGLKNGVTR